MKQSTDPKLRFPHSFSCFLLSFSCFLLFSCFLIVSGFCTGNPSSLYRKPPHPVRETPAGMYRKPQGKALGLVNCVHERVRG